MPHELSPTVFEDVSFQVHPHYVESLGTPSYTTGQDAGPLVRWTVRIAPRDDPADVEREWIVVELDGETQHDLLATTNTTTREYPEVGVTVAVSGELVETESGYGTETETGTETKPVGNGGRDGGGE